MNGMIFAAGLGTRLAPLTLSRPKALVEVAGRPLLHRAIDSMAQAGVDCLVVNAHHFASQIVDYIGRNRRQWRMDIMVSDESDLLLDTGGGVAKALPLFADDEPIVMLNADVVTDVPLGDLVAAHRKSGRDATLLTSPRPSTRHLLFGANGRLCGWEDEKNGKTRRAREAEVAFREAFNGVHVVEQRLVRAFGSPRPLPIVTAYLDCAEEFHIGRQPMPAGRYWFDVGTVEKLERAQKALEKR